MTLNQIVSIQRKTQVQQADMSLLTTLAEVAEVYAMVFPIRGSERNQGDQTEARANYRFTIHQRTDLLDDDVLVWNGYQYNIRFIADRGPGSIYLKIEAERGVAI